jgi:hypothetical protein
LQGVVYKVGKSAGEVKNHFSDFLLTAEVHSGRRAIEDFGQEMLARTWIKSEKEDAAIAELTAKPAPLAGLGHLKVFSMVSTVKRVMYEQPSNLTFCLLVAPLSALQQSEATFTYRQILGSGRLDEKDLNALRDIVLDAEATEKGIADFFEISKVRVSTSHQKGEVLPPIHSCPDDSRLLTYECQWEGHIDGPFTIEFEVKSIVLDQHAWHTYKTHWCIHDRLSVSLQSPSKLDCFCEVWPIKQEPPTKRVIKGGYKSVIDLKGPIFAGSAVRWVFHELEQPMTRGSRKTGAKKASAAKKPAKRSAAKKPAKRSAAKKTVAKRRRMAPRGNGPGSMPSPA